MSIDKLRDSDGKLPAYAWPGGYPIIYVTDDGAVLCPDCANRENGSLASTGPEERGTGWFLDGCDVHWEGAAELCNHCGAEIESAYGEPDTPSSN